MPHLPKLHTAMQLFPSGSTHETLLAWIRGQGITMKIFGVQVDSTLPGKFASVIISLAGAAAYGLARPYSQSASGLECSAGVPFQPDDVRLVTDALPQKKRLIDAP